MEKGVHNLLGLIIDKEYYKQRYRAKLPTLNKLDIYNETIKNNSTNVARSKD